MSVFLEKPSAFRAVRDAMTSVAFVVGLSGTFLRTLFGPSAFDPAAENRRPAPVPALHWADVERFPAKLEAAFADRLAFRPRFVRVGSMLRFTIGVSPSPKVLIGRDGFLFYTGEDALAQYQRAKPFSRRELAGWLAVLNARHDFLATRGIRYLVLVPPNKETIYPDRMPEEIHAGTRPSRLDQLLGALGKAGRTDALDLRPALMKAREHGLAYHRTDTHWNDRGAFAAYQTIGRFLGTWLPAIEPVPPAATETSTARDLGGDLSGLMALRDFVPEPARVTIRVRTPRARDADPGVRAAPNTAPHALPRASEIDDPRLPRALVFHDSFMGALRPYLAENFRRSVFLSTHDFPLDVIEREHPDVVVEELLERFLTMAAPRNPPEVWKFAARPAGSATPIGMDEAARPGEILPPPSGWIHNDLDRDDAGVLTVRGDDPWLATDVAPLDISTHRTIRVRMTVHAAPGGRPDARMAQLFWARPSAQYEERASQRFVIRADGQEHRYRVRLDLSHEDRGPIAHVRLDLPDGELGLRTSVASVELGD
ncbi:MAG TPA: hypothetical protein VHE30_07260 [Polyangiaceae bacterium]|nr:hypothetical protein [Polyangiaceae bacterium]